MNSRITIDVQNDGLPVIKVEYKGSDDVRDKLVKRFIEGFGYNSFYAKYGEIYTDENGKQIIELYPIHADDLKEEAKTMKAWADHLNGEKVLSNTTNNLTIE